MRISSNALVSLLLLSIGLGSNSVWAVKTPTTTGGSGALKRAAATLTSSSKRSSFGSLSSSDDESSSYLDIGTDSSPDTSKINSIFGGWLNDDIVAAMKYLINDATAEGMRGDLKEYLCGLLTSSDANLVSTFDETQHNLANTINNTEKYCGGGIDWMATFGEGLDVRTRFLLLANYVPHTDKNAQRWVVKDGLSGFKSTDSKPQEEDTVSAAVVSRQRRENSCMIKFCKSLPNSIIKEFNRKFPDSNPLPSITDSNGHPGVRLIDACCGVLDKDDYQHDIRGLIQDGQLRNKEEFYMITAITLGYQIRHYNFVNGKALPILTATANGRDNLLMKKLVYDDIKFTGNRRVLVIKDVAHGECWANELYLKQFDEKVLLTFGRSLALACSFLDGYEDLVKLSHKDDNNSRLGLRYSGIEFMTPEEKAALYLSRIYFYKCGTLASALFGGEEPLLEDDNWEEMQGKPKCLQDNGEISVLYDELLKCKQQQDDNVDHQKFHALLKEKYDSLVLGGELGGRWVTLSSYMFGGDKHLSRDDLSGYMLDLYKQLLSEHVQDQFGNEDDFVKRLERRYTRLVEGGEKAGSWCTLASFMFGDNKHLTRDDLEGNDFMKNLYVELLADGDDGDFVTRLEKRYKSLVKSGSWSKLASAFAATSPPWTRNDLSSEMEKLYAELLDGYTGDEDDFKERLKERYNCWGGNRSELRGCFDWWAGVDDLLQKVWSGVELSDAETERYVIGGHFDLKHVFESAKVLYDGMMNDKLSVEKLYTNINNALSIGLTGNDEQKRTALDGRWVAFAARHSERDDINLESLFLHRESQLNQPIAEKIRVKQENTHKSMAAGADALEQMNESATAPDDDHQPESVADLMG